MPKVPATSAIIKDMKKSGNDRTLESFKIYPYITWTLIIGFSVFVYNITQKLEAVTETLGAHAQFTEADLSTSTKAIKGLGEAPKLSQ